MTARSNFEASCHAALTRYKEAVAAGTWHVTADNTLVDHLLKAADVYVRNAIKGHLTAAQQRHEQHLAPLVELIHAAAVHGDTPLQQAQRRAALEAVSQ